MVQWKSDKSLPRNKGFSEGYSDVSLKGKTVMIATDTTDIAEYLQMSLENMGANVVFSERSPSLSSSVPVISEEVEKHSPKIDALIIFNSNIELPERRATALELIKRLKGSRPVIVCDSCENRVDIQELENAGAKYYNNLNLNPSKIAFAVADAVAQHGKPGKIIGG